MYFECRARWVLPATSTNIAAHMYIYIYIARYIDSGAFAQVLHRAGGGRTGRVVGRLDAGNP